MADREKHGKTNIQIFEYLENEKRFLGEIKNIFHSFWRAIIWWKIKNWQKTADTSFKLYNSTKSCKTSNICRSFAALTSSSFGRKTVEICATHPSLDEMSWIFTRHSQINAFSVMGWGLFYQIQNYYQWSHHKLQN